MSHRSYIVLSALLATVCHAGDRLTESPGRKVLPFSMLGSDGKKYDLRTLTRGKPVLVVNLTEGDLPLGVRDLNRLSAMMAGKVRVVGLVDATTPTGMRQLAKRHQIRFLVAFPYRGTGGGLYLQMEDRYRAYSYLGNALLLPSGRFTHIWSGYNRWTLKRMQSDALRYARVRLRLDLSKFPKKLQVGKIVHYGLGGP